MIRNIRWPPEGQAPTVSGEMLEAAPTDEAWVWVDLIDEDTAALRHHADVLGFDPAAITAVPDGMRLPDLEEHTDYLRIVLSGFVIGAEGRLGTANIDVVVGEGYLLTHRPAGIPMLETAAERILDGALLPHSSPMGLLAYFAMIGSRGFGPLLGHLEEQIEALEEPAIVADPRTVTEAHALRRDIILMRKALRPQRQVYDELYVSEHRLIAPRERRLFERVASVQANALEALDAAMQLLNSMLEIHSSATADQTNEIVRVLTVFSAVMLPLGLIAGIWGMNFDRIPAAAQDWGFWMILGVMLLVAIGLWLYFARRGFVGAPRLREVPRSVGLGLIQIGTAPIRVVSDGIDVTKRLVGLGDDGED